MISVVMSVYNAEKYLKEAIDSILNQTYQDFEFIIINDCSTDSSYAILKDYEKRYKCVRLINNEVNLGLTKNLNKALALAEGEYIARMDADDISDLNRFQRQIDFFKSNATIDILGTYCHDINEHGNTIRTRTVPVSHCDIVKMLPKFSPMSHPTVMFKRSSLEKIGFYNPKFRTSQDLEMWYRASAAGLKFHNIPEFLLKYRVDSNFLARKKFKFRFNDFKLRLECYKHINLPWYMYGYSVIPIILGFVPQSVYNGLKRIDPR